MTLESHPSAGSDADQHAPAERRDFVANRAGTAAAGEQAMFLAPRGNWSLLLLRGLLAIVFVLVAFVWPGATMASLVLLFSAYTLVDGVFAIASGVRAARAHERWGWLRAR